MSQLYDKAKEGFLAGDISLSDDSILIALASATYTPDFSTDTFISDVGVDNIVATSSSLANKSLVSGVFDCDDFIFESVSGDPVVQIILYDGSNSRLICCLDDVSCTPDGSAITVAFNGGSNKIFALNGDC